MRLFSWVGGRGELVLEAGCGLPIKGAGSRQRWAGYPFTCDVGLTVTAGLLEGGEHRQALEMSTVDPSGQALVVPEAS